MISLKCNKILFKLPYICYMKFLFIILFVIFPVILSAQFTDDFSDGDFTNNPSWTGMVSNFIVNNNNELQLDAPSVASSSYLVTESGAIEDAIWEFNLRMTFNPSGSNLAMIYLVSDQSNLVGPLNGYFVLVGDTPDEISLYRQDGTSTTKIIDGVDGRVNMSTVNVGIRVTRDQTGFWTLLSDTLGGTNYFQEGTSFDDTYQQSFYFGVRCNYTATRSSNFFFDNFDVSGDPFFDPFPAELISATATSPNNVQLQFDKAITQNSANVLSNYTVNLGIGNPIIAERNATDASKVDLTFSTPLILGTFYTIVVLNIEDLSGNISPPQNTELVYVEAQQPEYGDIIINEFLPRESPTVGLPERQFVELYNRSNKFFHLENWKLSDRTGTGTIQDAWLYPGEYLVLTPTGGLAAYDSISNNVINVTNWQTLNNTGDDIRLSTDNDITVDELSYTNQWYNDPNKSNGGYSIERINPTLNCGDGSNWRASQNVSGGTPGIINSVHNTDPDLILPKLISIFVVDLDQIEITFDKGMDTNSVLNNLIDWIISPNMSINSVDFDQTYPKQIYITFDQNIIAGELYEIEIPSIIDCNGNSTSIMGTFVLPQIAEKGDLIINEILHNTLVGGSDFIEVYNNSDKYLDLFKWELANHNNDTVANNRVIEQNYIIAPNDYVVITRDSTFQLENYPSSVSNKFIQLPSLPSYNNDSSTVYLIYDNLIMDKVSYKSDWHFRLLNSLRGVSLERHDPDGPSNAPSNWHSASETIGFATPGGLNSQRINFNTEGTLSLSSNTFSPDNDGFQDVLLISYQLSKSELVGKMVIFDDVGRPIKTLMNNHLLGNQGEVQWDGTTDNGVKASIGPKIIVFEAHDIETGEKVNIRKVVTLAGRL